MLDKEDLQAIGQMVDEKLSQQDKRMDEKLSQQDKRLDEKLSQQDKRLDEKLSQQDERLDEKLSQQDKRMDEKLAKQKTDIMQEVSVLIESKFDPKFNLLAEGQQAILEKMVPRSRVDELEEEMKFLKLIVRKMNEDIQMLKEAI